MKTFLLFGDYSGRNTGHNAHLLSAISELRMLGNCQILVPTLSPKAIRRVLYDTKAVIPIGVAPWNLSVKFLGLPIYQALAKSDLLILADNMFYDNHLFNPLKNNLMTLNFITSLAHKKSKPIVYLNSGVGPVHSTLGRSLVRRLARQMDLVILRDAESRDLYQEITGLHNSTVTADSGFSMCWSELCEDRPYRNPPKMGKPSKGERKRSIGVNLSRHLKSWLEQSADNIKQPDFIHYLAQGLENAARQNGDSIIFFVTHAGDLDITLEVARALERHTEVEILQEHDGSMIHNIAKILRNLRWVIGSRYHEIIMFASAGVPVLGLSCGEKIPGLFETLGLPELIVETESIANKHDTHRLVDMSARALASGEYLVHRAEELRLQAQSGVQLIRKKGLIA